MLSAKEFTVGSLAEAKPLSLMLPRTSHEATIIVGGTVDVSHAVFLSGEFKFGCFESSGGQNWRGLIVPNVQIEADETTLFDPQSNPPNLGALIRAGTQLLVWAKPEQSFGRPSSVVLEDGLPPTSAVSAGFTSWRIVIGEGQDKRELFKLDTGLRP